MRSEIEHQARARREADGADPVGVEGATPPLRAHVSECGDAVGERDRRELVHPPEEGVEAGRVRRRREHCQVVALGRFHHAVLEHEGGDAALGEPVRDVEPLVRDGEHGVRAAGADDDGGAGCRRGIREHRGQRRLHDVEEEEVVRVGRRQAQGALFPGPAL